MSACRFMYENHLDSADRVTASSIRPGMVGMPAPRARGSAVAYALGEHTGLQDQVFTVRIDSLDAGNAVGQATFRWKTGDDDTWRQTGVTASETPRELADGVSIKWIPGVGDDFALGDEWSILASRAFGPASFLDGDRDTWWESTGVESESLTLDLGLAQRVRAVVLADHNLSAGGEAVLMADPSGDWEDPEFSLGLDTGGSHLAAFLDRTCRYWRLSLNDPGNPDGILKASLLYLGGCFEPSRQFRQGFSRSLTASRALTATDSGKKSGGAYGLGQSFNLSFNQMGEADLAGFKELFQAVHHSKSGSLNPVFFTPFADAPLDTVYCLPGASLSWTRLHQGGPSGPRYSLEIGLEEMVKSNV